jgi:PAS domain S-box-containing protein
LNYFFIFCYDDSVEKMMEMEKELYCLDPILSTIIENSDEAIIIVQDKKIQFCNKTFLNLLQFSKKNIHLEDLKEFFHPDDFDMVMTRHQQRLHDEPIPSRYTFRVINQQKRLIYLEIHSLKIDWYGKPAILSFLSDCSDQTYAVNQLHQSELFKKKLLDFSPLGILFIDPKGYVTYENQAMKTMMGVPQQQESPIFNQNILHLPGIAKSGIIPLLAKALKGKPVRKKNIVYRSLMGKRLNLEIYCAPISDSANQITGIIIQAIDTTHRHQMEQALIESEQKFRQLFENSPFGMIILNHQRRITEINQQITQMLGYSLKEMKGSKLSGYIDDEDRNVYKELINHLYQRQIPQFQHQIRFIDNYRQSIWMNQSSILIHDTSKKTVNGLIILENISIQRQGIIEKEKLEAQLRKSQKMEAIGTLAGGIAHDFNNILSIINGYTELLMDEIGNNSTAKKYIQQMLIASRRAKGLIQQILTYSSQGEPHSSELLLPPFIKESLKLIQASTPANIQIYSHIKNIQQPVLADPTHIHQIILNLCVNANDAMAENGGTLRISLDEVSLSAKDIGSKDLQPGIYQRLTVSDTGHGISETVKSRIFDPYFTTKKPGKGTGMGLSLVHRIVKKYGGDITVTSNVGIGTTFQVYFPVPALPFLHIQPHESLLEHGKADKHTTIHILFVDDEPQIVEIANMILSASGFTVTATKSSPEALELVKKNPMHYQLVITDMSMPTLTGIQLAKEIHQIRQELPIILCSGYNDSINQNTYQTYNIQYFIQKPFVKKDLLDGINFVLNKAKKGITP